MKWPWSETGARSARVNNGGNRHSPLGCYSRLRAVASAVAGRLHAEQLRVQAVSRREFGVPSLLDDLPVLEHDDPVGHAYGREPVRDDDRHAPGHQLVEAKEDVVLGARIERRGGLVENEHL